MNNPGRNRKYKLVELDLVQKILIKTNGSKRRAARILKLTADEFMSSVLYYQRKGHTFPKAKTGRPSSVDELLLQDSEEKMSAETDFKFYPTQEMVFQEDKNLGSELPDFRSSSRDFLYMALRENSLKFKIFQYVVVVMNSCSCNRTAAAQILGISIRTLRNYINEIRNKSEWKDLYEMLGKKSSNGGDYLPATNDTEPDYQYLPRGYDRFREFDDWNNRDFY